MWAVVPCKNFKYAKSRLASVMTATERSRLAYAMLSDVLAVLTNIDDVRGIVIVSSDPLAHRCAMIFDALWVTENCDDGLSNALTAACNFLKNQGAAGVIAVSGDLPLLKPSDISCVLSTLKKKPSVTLAPANRDFGTNLLAMMPVGAIPYMYGENSFSRHLSAAEAIDIEPIVIRTPGLGFDIDTIEDLRTFVYQPSDTQTYHYLEESGIRDRLFDENKVNPAAMELAPGATL